MWFQMKLYFNSAVTLSCFSKVGVFHPLCYVKEPHKKLEKLTKGITGLVIMLIEILAWLQGGSNIITDIEVVSQMYLVLTKHVARHSPCLKRAYILMSDMILKISTTAHLRRFTKVICKYLVQCKENASPSTCIISFQSKVVSKPYSSLSFSAPIPNII